MFYYYYFWREIFRQLFMKHQNPLLLEEEYIETQEQENV